MECTDMMLEVALGRVRVQVDAALYSKNFQNECEREVKTVAMDWNFDSTRAGVQATCILSRADLSSNRHLMDRL
jgi:hypothetical protein